MGDCVHVAGLYNFMRIAENEGYQTVFLGPAVDVAQLADALIKEKPDMVGISYRLTPEAFEKMVPALKRAFEGYSNSSCTYLFGGTPPVTRIAVQSGLFAACFDGTETEEAMLNCVRGEEVSGGPEKYPTGLVERINWKRPFPIIRHHFGLPTMPESLHDIVKLAESCELDVISLAPDQNAQESFFRPEEMDPLQDGAGGMPVRTEKDFCLLYEATRIGNYPLLRSYAGTRDLLPMGSMLKKTINQAWAAIPLCWYSELDGRSTRPLENAIREALAVIRWHGENGIPVEVNEAHQWSLRDAPDTIAVAMAFLAAYNAKKAGVKHYVAQYMLNNPPGTSPAMDLAKMLAKIELIESLHDDQFCTYRQTRTGLTSLPSDIVLAKGHLAASTMLQMALRPHIVHVVAHCEADHAARADDIIEAVKIAKGAIKLGLYGFDTLVNSPEVKARKEELIAEATILLDAIKSLAPASVNDPWADPATLATAVRYGLLDAPHLRDHKVALGLVSTRIIEGACRAINPQSGKPLSEDQRIMSLKQMKFKATI